MDKEQQKNLLVELMELDEKDGLYETNNMKQETKYYITQEQLEDIEYFKRMFEYNADLIQILCSSEKDEIVYGFELGQRYRDLRECYMKMMKLESDIRIQNFPNKKPFVGTVEEFFNEQNK